MNHAFRLLFDQLRSGVAWVQRNGDVRYANKAAVQLTPCMIGRPFPDPVIDRHIRAAGEQRLQLPFQFEISTQEIHPDRVRAVIVPAPVGQDLMLVLNNVSEEHWYSHAHQNLIKFMQIEMGDPAEQLSVNLQALGTPGVPRRDDLIREVLEQTRRLQAGLGRLHELASVFGCAALHCDDRIVLTELVPQALKALAHLMDQRNVSIRLEGFEQEVAVYGSAEWLARALREYLDCAVRSAQRGAAIDLVLQGSGQRVMLRSRNRGLFMSSRARRAAMVPFGVGDDPSQPGPSIGLALAQHIVELHGGSVRIEDEAGSVDFVLELPAGAPAEQATQLSAEQAQRYARDMAQLMSRSMARRDAVPPGSKT